MNGKKQTVKGGSKSGAATPAVVPGVEESPAPEEPKGGAYVTKPSDRKRPANLPGRRC